MPSAHETVDPARACSTSCDVPFALIRPRRYRRAEVWDNEDFITYFEGHRARHQSPQACLCLEFLPVAPLLCPSRHWETWEFNKETQSVRLRPPEELLHGVL